MGVIFKSLDFLCYVCTLTSSNHGGLCRGFLGWTTVRTVLGVRTVSASVALGESSCVTFVRASVSGSFWSCSILYIFRCCCS